MSDSRLIIRDLTLMMSMGIHEHEKQAKQRVCVHVSVDLAQAPDSRRDHIDDVLSYDDIIQNIKHIAFSKHFNLVERLAEEIADMILTFEQAASCTVQVLKPDIYDDVESVGIEITRRQPGLPS